MQRRAGEPPDAAGSGEPGASADEDPAGSDGPPRADRPRGRHRPGRGGRLRHVPGRRRHHWGDGSGDAAATRARTHGRLRTPLRAVKDVKVRKVSTQAAAGRYVVLHDGDSGQDFATCTCSACDVSVGDALDAAVRRRGGPDRRRDGLPVCSFEEWTSPGWYTGAHAEDPLPLLTSLDES